MVFRMDENNIKELAKELAKELKVSDEDKQKQERKMIKSGPLNLLEMKLSSCNLLDENDALVLKALDMKVPSLATIDSKQRGKKLHMLPIQTLEWLSKRSETSTKMWTINIYASLVRLSPST